jgi:hypothetical protein
MEEGRVNVVRLPILAGWLGGMVCPFGGVADKGEMCGWRAGGLKGVKVDEDEGDTTSTSWTVANERLEAGERMMRWTSEMRVLRRVDMVVVYYGGSISEGGGD